MAVQHNSPFACGGTVQTLTPIVLSPNRKLTIRTDSADTGRVYILVGGGNPAANAQFYLDPGNALELGPEQGVTNSNQLSLVNSGGDPDIYWG